MITFQKLVEFLRMMYNLRSVQLGQIKEIQNLSSLIHNHTPETNIGLIAKLWNQKREEFQKDYKETVKQLARHNVPDLCRETPERIYLNALIQDSGLIEELDTPTERLNISPRLKKILQKADIKYLGQITVATEAEILTLEGLGDCSFNQLKDELKSQGLYMMMNFDYIPPEKRQPSI